MDLGHGFIPRLDAWNYKAVERCLARDGPGMFHERLDLPWAILEGPWAADRGTSTLELWPGRVRLHMPSRTLGRSKLVPTLPSSIHTRTAESAAMIGG